MALSQNQKLTLGIAVLSFVISAAVSGLGIWLQHKDLSKDRAARCNDDVAQFQSDLSVAVDSLLKSAGDLKLGLKTVEAGQLDDLLINYRRNIRLFEKKQKSRSCSSQKADQFNGLTTEIDSVRNNIASGSDFGLNKLIDLSKALAQDDSLSPDCCQ